MNFYSYLININIGRIVSVNACRISQSKARNMTYSEIANFAPEIKHAKHYVKVYSTTFTDLESTNSESITFFDQKGIYSGWEIRNRYSIITK